MFVECQQGDLPSRDAMLRLRQLEREERMIRNSLMQLNERVRRRCRMNKMGDCDFESMEPPSKRMRKSCDLGLGWSPKEFKNHRLPSRQWPHEQKLRQQHRQLQKQKPKQRSQRQQELQVHSRVRFAETSKVIVLPHRTPEDTSNSWFARSEVAGFKRRAKLHAAQLGSTKTAAVLNMTAYRAATTHRERTHDHVRDEAEAGGDDGGRAPTPPSPTPHDVAPSPSPEDDVLDEAMGVEHLICPAVAKVLLHQRAEVLRRVLEEQSRIVERPRPESTDETADRIARAAREATSFSREWTRRVLGLHGESP